MNWASIRAVLRQEFYMTRSSWEVIADVFFFSLANILAFGFIAAYLARSGSPLVVESLLIAVIFWEVLRINQYSMSISSMWNVWSHNLCNMFIAPIRVVDYLIAHFIAALTKSLIVFGASLLLAAYVFHLNILSLGLGPIVVSYFNMVVFAVAIGLILLGLVFRFGTRIQALTWGTIFVIQPLCAVYFPVNVLPGWLQPVSDLIPVTYSFEWLRAIHTGATYSGARVAVATLYNLLWLIAGCYIFSRHLAAAKRSGQLVRNDL